MEPKHKTSATIYRNSIITGAVCLVVIAFATGWFFGSHTTAGAVTVNNAGVPDNADLTNLWKAWKILDDNFVPTASSTKSTNEQKVDGLIEGLASSYKDPYTVYFPPKENEVFQSQISGNFEGVGMEIGIRNNILTVIAPLKDTPASRAGIQSGDQIVKINATSTEGMSVEDAVSFIRGPHGTTVTFSIAREGAKALLTIPVTRDVINLPTVDTKLRNDGVFVINLYTFTATSPNLFRNALQQFANSGSSKLVIDLRNNPGGYLEAAVDMASWFLPAGSTVVTEDFGGKQENNIHRSYGYDVFNHNTLKVVVLINRGSASASEILAGALKDHGIAELVGERSFGKGSVQQLIPLTDKSSIKVTVARWLTPSGISISGGGLQPDIAATLTADDVTAGKDPQMDAAVKYLLSK